MSIINNILTYSDLFNEQAKTIDCYLSPIKRDTLIDYAIKLLSLSTVHEIYKEENVLWAFLTKEEKALFNSLYQTITQKRQKNGVSSCIINVRTSLNFFEYAFKNTTLNSSISESQQNVNVLKAYLLLNEKSNEERTLQERDYEIEEIMLHNALEHERYIDENLVYLRLVQLIKACIFFEFCEKNLPFHLKEFEKFYNISTWKTYIIYLHQIGMLIHEHNLETPFITVTISEEDKDFIKKKDFLNKFCLQKYGWDDNQDYTALKNTPIIQSENNEYKIIFEEFFCEKVYQSLYFKFKEINNSFKETQVQFYIKNFRSYIGLEFSERSLTNQLLSNAFGNKYIQLNYENLQDGDIDYYIRNGKYIFLFECKDNLIGKDILEECNIDKFIQKLRELFIETNSNNKSRDKAINQLINNIEKILNKEYPDKKYNRRNCYIYPIIVTHNNIFSLTGVNAIVNNWFKEELSKRNIIHPYIKELTIISIDTIALFQGIFAQKGFSIKDMINKYWKNYKSIENKKYPTAVDVIKDYPTKYQSFKKFVENSFHKKDLFTKEILKYSDFFNRE